MWKSKPLKLSIIDKDVKVDGTITGKGRLIIRGTVNGSIAGETVVIAEEGRVTSDAKVACMTISGVFDGDIDADGEVVITSSGKCSGKISCKDIVVENGGILNAEVISRGEQVVGGASESDEKIT